MLRTTLVASALALVCLPLLAPSHAQGVAARADVRAGCTVPGPVGSLRAAPTSPETYLPASDGSVRMECEAPGAVGQWVLETTQGGYSGAGYLRWNGPNLFNTPGVDVLSFPFVVEDAQAYVFRLWSQQNNGDSSEENDCWIRVDGGEWHKIFGWQVGVWNQNAVVEGTNDLLQEFLGTGVHVVELAGRSTNFKIDRIDAVPSAIWWSDINAPTAEAQRDRPVLGTTFYLELGDPTGAEGFGPAAVVAIALARTPAGNCGVVVPGTGELLADFPTLVDPFLLPWGGGAQTTGTSFAVPADASLVGQVYTFQGALLEPGHVVLTRALDVTLGDV